MARFGIFKAARGDFSQDGQFETVRVKFEGVSICDVMFSASGEVCRIPYWAFSRDVGKGLGDMVSASKKRGQKCLPFPI